MKNFLVNGCYDQTTFRVLSELGVEKFAFDLRPTSLNFISFKDLQTLLDDFRGQEIILIFQNESQAVIFSFLDLLKKNNLKFILQFRDQKDPGFYHALKTSWLWMFDPKAQWREILTLPYLEGVLLPYKWRSQYSEWDELWEIIDQQRLNVFIHAEDFEEALRIKKSEGLQISVDIDQKVEKRYRSIDIELLKNICFRSQFNEDSSLK
jgi:hypothetical protein